MKSGSGRFLSVVLLLFCIFFEEVHEVDATQRFALTSSSRGMAEARESIAALIGHRPHQRARDRHRRKHRLRRLQHHAHRRAKAMSVSTAARHLGQRLSALPRSVASLLRSDSHSHTSTGYAPSEESIQSALGIFNGMMSDAWARLDTKIVECQEFQEQSKARREEVATSLARLADRLAELKGERNTAISQIQEVEEEFGEVTRRRKEELALHSERVAGFEHEKQLRRDDRDVALLIASVTRCSSTGLIQLHEQESHEPQHAMSSLAKSTRLCERDDKKGFYLKFDNEKSRLEAMKKMTPRMRQLLHRTVSIYTGGRNNQLGGLALAQVRALHRLMQDPVVEPADEPVEPDEPVVPSANETAANGSEALNFTEMFTTTMAPIEVALSPPEEQAKKCTLGDVSCGPLHKNAATLLGEASDAIDQVSYDMSKAQEEHDAMLADFNLQLQLLAEAKKQYNSQLSGATSKMNGIEDERLHMEKEARELQSMATTHGDECTKEISEILYTEMCSLRTVRGAIVSHSGTLTPEDIVDCEVSDWLPGECSKSCDDACPRGSEGHPCGGTQFLTRTIIQDPNQNGASCPALSYQSRCNQVQCPVDCEVSHWSGWSACSKDCDGGVRQRTRSILQQPKNGGEVCDAVTETQSCNTGSCDKDCVLKPWTAWSGCSAVCGTGYKQRFKRILAKAAGGGGKCASRTSSERYEVATCNEEQCEGDEVCVAKQDVLLLVDSGGSLAEADFASLRDFAAGLVARYRSTAYAGDAAHVGVLQFGNGEIMPDGTVSTAHEVAPISSDLAGVEAAVRGMGLLGGFPNVAQALGLAERVLGNHARSMVPGKVILITDSKPTFQRQAIEKAQDLWDRNVHTFIVSVSRFQHGENAQAVKQLASMPRQSNFVHIPGIANLREHMSEHVVHVLTKACAKTESPSFIADEGVRTGFRLLAEDKACGNPASRTVLSRTESMSAEECANLARAQDLTFFGLGVGARSGYCWAESAGDASCTGQGFQSAFSDFYEIMSG